MATNKRVIKIEVYGRRKVDLHCRCMLLGHSVVQLISFSSAVYIDLNQSGAVKHVADVMSFNADMTGARYNVRRERRSCRCN